MGTADSGVEGRASRAAIETQPDPRALLGSIQVLIEDGYDTFPCKNKLWRFEQRVSTIFCPVARLHRIRRQPEGRWRFSSGFGVNHRAGGAFPKPTRNAIGHTLRRNASAQIARPNGGGEGH